MVSLLLPRSNPGNLILMYQRSMVVKRAPKHTWESLKTARRTMLPERARMLNLQSTSDPGNIMLAWRNCLDFKTSHPRHLSLVGSSSKRSSSTTFFRSRKGIGISSSVFLIPSFATQTWNSQAEMCKLLMTDIRATHLGGRCLLNTKVPVPGQIQLALNLNKNAEIDR